MFVFVVVVCELQDFNVVQHCEIVPIQCWNNITDNSRQHRNKQANWIDDLDWKQSIRISAGIRKEFELLWT